jgi:hypothetical protein
MKEYKDKSIEVRNIASDGKQLQPAVLVFVMETAEQQREWDAMTSRCAAYKTGLLNEQRSS